MNTTVPCPVVRLIPARFKVAEIPAAAGAVGVMNVFPSAKVT